MGWEERITVNPAVRSGKPCLKGTRIAVYDVLEYLAGGMTERDEQRGQQQQCAQRAPQPGAGTEREPAVEPRTARRQASAGPSQAA